MTSKKIRNAASEIGREIGARLIVLFGSMARGAGAPEDIDLGVLSAGPLDLVALTHAFTRRLDTQAVDLVDLGRADPLLLMLAARDGIPVYEGAPGEFARFVSLAARRYADTRKFRETERREILDFLAERGR